MNIKNMIRKTAVLGALTLSVVTGAVPNTVSAERMLKTAETKDYNQVIELSKKAGIHEVALKYYNFWVPGNNVEDAFQYEPYERLVSQKLDPGRVVAAITGAGRVHGRNYVAVQNYGSPKSLIPAAYFRVPYGFNFKSGHKAVYCYHGSLAHAYDGWDSYLHAFTGSTLTDKNTIYMNHGSKKKLTLSKYGQSHGRNRGFFIGQTPIRMNDGKRYYPVYGYTPLGVLNVVYIKPSAMKQFKPAKVTYSKLGTLSKTAGKPYYHNFRSAWKAIVYK